MTREGARDLALRIFVGDTDLSEEEKASVKQLSVEQLGEIFYSYAAAFERHGASVTDIGPAVTMMLCRVIVDWAGPGDEMRLFDGTIEYMRQEMVDLLADPGRRLREAPTMGSA